MPVILIYFFVSFVLPVDNRTSRRSEVSRYGQHVSWFLWFDLNHDNSLLFVVASLFYQYLSAKSTKNLQ
jgi:hypothetical protein